MPAHAPARPARIPSPSSTIMNPWLRRSLLGLAAAFCLPPGARAALPAREPAAGAPAPADLAVIGFDPRALAPEPPAPASTPAPRRGPVLAVLDFETDTLSAGQAVAFSQALWSMLLAREPLRLLPREETRRWLIARDLHPGLPYMPYIPVDAVLGPLRARYLVTGHLDQVGDLFAMTLTLHAEGRSQPVLQDVRFERSSLEDLVRDTLPLADRIAAAIIAAENETVRRPLAPAATERSAPGTPGIKLAEPAPRKHAPPPAKVRLRKAKVVEEAPEPKPAPVEELRVEDRTAVDGPVLEPAPAPTPAPEPAQTPTPKPTATPKPAATPRPAATPAPTPAATPPSVPQAKNSTASADTPTSAATPTPAPAGAAERAMELYRQASQLAARTDERLALLRQAAELSPAEFVFQQSLANEYYLRENYEACVEAAGRALAVDADNAMILTIRGAANYGLDRYDAARADFERALELDADNHFARYNLALTHHMQKSPQARELWEDYLKRTEGVADQETLRQLARRFMESAVTPRQ